MYLEDLASKLIPEFKGTLFSVRDIKKKERNAKEYLYRLEREGKVQRVSWGWYYFPQKQDAFSFLKRDKNFKIITKQTAASYWNYDFVHRDVVWVAVKDTSYGRALKELSKKMNWEVEVESAKNVEYQEIDGLLMESKESCIVRCISDWAILDGLAILFERKNELSWKKLKEIARWKRLAKTNLRVWNVLKYACGEYNNRIGKNIFKIRKSALSMKEVKKIVDESVEKVVEFE